MALETLARAATDLLQQYGWLALAAMSVLEGLMLLYFTPSEALVPAGIVLLADSTVEAALVVVVVVVGSTVGQFLLFSAAKRGGRELLAGKRWARVTSGLDRFERWFDRYGRGLVAVTNTLLLVRGMITVPAGLAGMDDREFLVLSAAGTTCFQTLLALGAVYAPDLLAGLL